MSNEKPIEIDRDKLMWIQIRSGLLGLKKAMTYTTKPSAAIGIAQSALGRIILAIELRWGLQPTEDLDKIEGLQK